MADSQPNQPFIFEKSLQNEYELTNNRKMEAAEDLL